MASCPALPLKRIIDIVDLLPLHTPSPDPEQMQRKSTNHLAQKQRSRKTQVWDEDARRREEIGIVLVYILNITTTDTELLDGKRTLFEACIGSCSGDTTMKTFSGEDFSIMVNAATPAGKVTFRQMGPTLIRVDVQTVPPGGFEVPAPNPSSIIISYSSSSPPSDSDVLRAFNFPPIALEFGRPQPPNLVFVRLSSTASSTPSPRPEFLKWLRLLFATQPALIKQDQLWIAEEHIAQATVHDLLTPASLSKLLDSIIPPTASPTTLGPSPPRNLDQAEDLTPPPSPRIAGGLGSRPYPLRSQPCPRISTRISPFVHPNPARSFYTPSIRERDFSYSNAKESFGTLAVIATFLAGIDAGFLAIYCGNNSGEKKALLDASIVLVAISLVLSLSGALIASGLSVFCMSQLEASEGYSTADLDPYDPINDLYPPGRSLRPRPYPRSVRLQTSNTKSRVNAALPQLASSLLAVLLLTIASMLTFFWAEFSSRVRVTTTALGLAIVVWAPLFAGLVVGSETENVLWSLQGAFTQSTSRPEDVAGRFGRYLDSMRPEASRRRLDEAAGYYDDAAGYY